jgi:diguanylate cyclase (GGDEF)-like protein/PAS domain S-box-containing protein
MRIQAEANLSALIESTEDLIWSVDSRYRLITFNRAFQEHFQRNFGGPVAPGVGLSELMPPAHAVLWPPLYERALRGEQFRIEYTLTDRRILDLTFSPILVDGAITGVSVFGKDISERKAAERKYQEIFEGALEGFFQTTPEGRFLTVNRALATILGYDSPQDLIASVTDVAQDVWVNADERARLLRQLEEQGYIQDYECRFKRKDGSVIWVLQNARCVRNEEKNARFFEGSIQDISERKRAEEALKKTEANLSTLIESTEDLIWSVDLDYRLVSFNHALRQDIDDNFGIRAAAGMSPSELLPPERAEFWPRYYERALTEGPFRTEYLLADGRTLELSFNPIIVEGKTTGVSVFGKDISERKQAMQTLAESEERFRATFEQAAVGIVHVSFEGKILSCNHRFAQIVGYAPEEVANLTVKQLTAPEDVAESVALIRRIENGGDAETLEKRYLRKDGSIFWARTTVSMQRSSRGEPLHLSAFIEDINLRKQAEQALNESSDFLKEAQRIGDLGCYVLDVAAGIWSSTSLLDEIFGIDPSYQRSVTGWETLVHPADRERMATYFAKEVIGRRKPFDAEYRIVRQRDGAVRWVRGLGKLEFDAQGKPLKMRGIISDITAHRQWEAQLQESEERFRAVTETSPLAIVLSSGPDERVEYVNPAFTRLFGYTREDIPTAADWWPLAYPDPEYRRQVMEDWKRSVELAIRTGRAIDRVENVVASKDGSKKIIEWGLVSAGGRNMVFGNDITERKRAENELRESEERFRSTFEQAPVGIVQASLDGRYISSNARFAEIIGYPLNEVHGLSFQQITAPEDMDASNKMYRKLLSGVAPASSIEKRYLRKDGSLIWVRVTVSPQHDDARNIQYYIAIVEDISARKAAEERLAAAAEELRASEERYRTAFQTSIDAISLSRLDDGTLLDVNQAFLDMFGYQREEVIGKSSLEIVAWTDQNDRHRLAERLRKERVSRNLEYQLQRKNRERFWGLGSGSLFELNGVTCILFVIRDISASKAAAEALRTSEERYRTAFQTSIDAITLSHLKDGRFVDVNQAFLRMFGYQREEVVGLTSLELNIWTNLRDRQKLVKALRRDSVCMDMEFLLNRKGGQSFWVLVSGAMIELDGVPSFMLVVRDLTVVKAVERRLIETQEALRLSEERHRLAFQTSPNAVSIIRLEDGEFLDVNETFLNIMGFSRDEVMGKTLHGLNLWVDTHDRKNILEVLRRDHVFRGDVQLRKKNGDCLWGRVSASVFEHEGVSSVLTVTQDISEAKAAEQQLVVTVDALRRSEQRYRTAFQTSLDAISICHMADGRFVDVNEAYLELFGYQREELIGHTSPEMKMWVDHRDRQTMVDFVRANSSFRSSEVQFRKKNGDIVWGEMSASEIDLDGTPCILAVTRDISQAKAAANTIRDLAYYDSLTGLPNRRLLLDRLRQTLSSSDRGRRSQALLFVELDNFKTLNETLGHQTGDQLLQEVARRIVACAQDADTVSRLGGDEFAVMLEDLSESAGEAAAQAEAVGAKILASISQPFRFEDRECLTTASIGITIFKDQREGTDELMQRADVALYQAKAAGRNTIHFFSPALQAAVNARATLEDDLRHAIRERQFLLYYQPQVARGRTTGAEALIRWQHPKNGMVPPDEFIPLAEETGLILPLGEWVLETACAQIAAWSTKKKTSHISLAVNISALQFRQAGFVDTVLKALERTGANPTNLKLELTESMLVENIEDVITKMTELKSHNLSFSLDDFGTGYSSLAYLKRLPLDQLKIDRAFVRDMLVDVTSGAIAQTIISLGRAMGLSVIAEGVETEEQRGFLAGLGCHTFQGTLFSSPLPLEEFEAIL